MFSAQTIGSFGAVSSIALGVFGLIFPLAAAKFVSIQPSGRLGTSEIRATYGGLFIGLGAACLYLQHPSPHISQLIAQTRFLCEQQANRGF